MTESLDTTAPDTDAADAASRERFREKVAYDTDLRLDNMLSFIFGVDDEHLEGTATIMLITPGGVIEGMLVHPKKYATSQIDSVAEKSPEIARGLQLVEDGMDEIIAERKANFPDEPRAHRTYLHFLEATVTTGNNRFFVKDLRVDLTTVIGWSLKANLYEA